MRFKIFAGALLVAGACMFSHCNNSSPDQYQLTDAALDDSLNGDSFLQRVLGALVKKAAPCTDCGEVVHTSEVKPCLQAYIDTMKLHGIDATGKLRNVLVKKGRMITTDEIFRGKEIGKFLLKAKRLKTWLGIGAGTKMTVKVAFGIYTKDYVMGRPNPDLKKIGRIGVFIITCPRDQTIEQFLKDTSDIKTLLGPGDDDPESFDFGGLHP